MNVAPPASDLVLRLEAISKAYPGVQALDRVSVEARAGEVIGIVGENGAGKSTLLKILGGIVRPDEGQILIDGVPRRLSSVRDALALGIGLIHQELNLAPALSVAENLFLGRQPTRGPRWLALADRRRMLSMAQAELQRVGLPIAPQQLVARLNIAHRQLVEVAKALSLNARVLVFDEPTSSLSQAETARLLGIVEDLRRRGATILYVSHRLEEICQLADRVVVLRDGRLVGTLERREVTRERMIALMVGRDLAPPGPRPQRVRPGVPALEVRNLRRASASPSVSFSIQPGEIVGFAGIVGAGRTELARALFGVDRRAGGAIYVQGRACPCRNPRQAIEAGLAYVPEDRQAHGLLLQLSVQSNASLAVLGRLGRWGWYNRRAEAALANRFRESLNIRAASLASRASSLSGGNQQKVVLAKWLATQPQALLLDEPTRGVDVGAKQEIFRLIGQLAEQGMGVMLISSEMEEIVGASDRVVVLCRGAVAGELSGDQITEQAIMRLAVGDSETQRA